MKKLKKKSYSYYKNGYPNHKYFRRDVYPKRVRVLKKIRELKWSGVCAKELVMFEEIADFKFTETHINNGVIYQNLHYKYKPRWRAVLNMEEKYV